MKIDRTITPHLWFNTNAEEAVNFYISLFANSAVGKIARFGDEGPGPKGEVMAIAFTLNGQEYAALNGGPRFTFNEAASFLVWCETQDEIDSLYASLLAGGSELACGWLKDRFGLVWQVNYAGMMPMLSGPDADAAGRVMRAMGAMKKIDIQRLKAAYAGA
jgi:predicted 3-demethylubiquinone-9 3-methyltransferase (glyoxalase superfamily)